MIELTFMDKDYQVQGFLDQFTSLVWTRRYYDIGEFELRIPRFAIFHCSRKTGLYGQRSFLRWA